MWRRPFNKIKWSYAGSGWGLDEGDRLALGLLFELHQESHLPRDGAEFLMRVQQRFLEAHCPELPSWWGPKS